MSKTKTATKPKAPKEKKFDYHLEVDINDKLNVFESNDLHQSLIDFSNSTEFPPIVKTGVIFRYSKDGGRLREKAYFNASEARKLFSNKLSLQLLAETMDKELNG